MINPDQRSAELIGVILGDGSLNIYPSKKFSTFYRLKISFHKEEIAYLNYIKNLAFLVLGVKPYVRKRSDEKTAELLLFRKKVIMELIDTGLVISPKRDRARIPEKYVTHELRKYLLRGYFDTDGSVVITNNNGLRYPRLEMKICRSPMQEQLLQILRELSFSFGAYAIGNGEVRVQMNGRVQLEKWLRDIGFSNPKHMKRAKSVIHYRQLHKSFI